MTTKTTKLALLIIALVIVLSSFACKPVEAGKIVTESVDQCQDITGCVNDAPVTLSGICEVFGNVHNEEGNCVTPDKVK